MLTPRENSPLTEKFSSEEDRTHDAASSRTASPTHYQRAIPAPRSRFKSRSSHTIDLNIGSVADALQDPWHYALHEGVVVPQVGHRH